MLTRARYTIVDVGSVLIIVGSGVYTESALKVLVVGSCELAVSIEVI